MPSPVKAQVIVSVAPARVALNVTAVASPTVTVAVSGLMVSVGFGVGVGALPFGLARIMVQNAFAEVLCKPTPRLVKLAFIILAQASASFSQALNASSGLAGKAVFFLFSPAASAS